MATSTVHLAMLIAALLAILSGLLSLVGIRNPKQLSAEATPGGAICGASSSLPAPEAAREVQTSP